MQKWELAEARVLAVVDRLDGRAHIEVLEVGCSLAFVAFPQEHFLVPVLLSSQHEVDQMGEVSIHPSCRRCLLMGTAYLVPRIERARLVVAHERVQVGSALVVAYIHQVLPKLECPSSDTLEPVDTVDLEEQTLLY